MGISPAMKLLQLGTFGLGLGPVASTLAAAARTLVLPRGANVWPTTVVSRVLGVDDGA